MLFFSGGESATQFQDPSPGCFKSYPTHANVFMYLSPCHWQGRCIIDKGMTKNAKTRHRQVADDQREANRPIPHPSLLQLLTHAYRTPTGDATAASSSLCAHPWRTARALLLLGDTRRSCPQNAWWVGSLARIMLLNVHLEKSNHVEKSEV